MKPDGVFRIVCFGGSTSENKYAHHLEGIHYPGLLQEHLRERTGRDSIEVINLGSDPVDIAGWYLSDDEDLLRKAQIPGPSLVIPAGGRHGPREGRAARRRPWG